MLKSIGTGPVNPATVSARVVDETFGGYGGWGKRRNLSALVILPLSLPFVDGSGYPTSGTLQQTQGVHAADHYTGWNPVFLPIGPFSEYSEGLMDSTYGHWQ